ncbi:MAG: response regulator transcription factor [Lachnospiraceae bacterium]|nr:response regulator transcription factor [Lachnospiraceae bacterium]
MLKVLIADDEKKVCQLIEKLVCWQELGMQIIATAENGIDALERIREHHPDIVITDIRMPGYDGLDLIRLGKEASPRTEFIIISGYRHFEYAQSAIRYGVNAYILKPIKKEELTGALKKLGSKFREKDQQLTYEEQIRLTLKTDEETLRQAFLSDLVYRRNKSRLACPLGQIRHEFHFSFSPGCFAMAILKMDCRVLDNKENLHFMSDKASSILERLLAGFVCEYEVTNIGSTFYLLLNFQEEQKGNVRRQLKAFLDEIRIQGDILEGFCATMSLGTICHEPAGLDASLKNARLWIEERLVAGTGKLYEGEFPQYGSFAESPLFLEFNKKMTQALETLEVSPVRQALMELKRDLLSRPGVTGHEILQMAKEACNLYLFSMRNFQIPIEEGFPESFLTGADNCPSSEELFHYLIRSITSSYEKAAALKRQDENRPVRMAKRYVADHYQEPLTLEQVSLVAGLSPAYLSTVFKKDTGMTFLEYLSKIRMDAAKRLLKETNRTIADICGLVGYNDVRHFTKTFTKYSGLKPNEYRKLYS